MSKLVLFNDEGEEFYDSIMVGVVNNNLQKLDSTTRIFYKRSRKEHSIILEQSMEDGIDVQVIIFNGRESAINPFLIGFNAAIKHCLTLKSGLSVMEVETRSQLDNLFTLGVLENNET